MRQHRQQWLQAGRHARQGVLGRPTGLVAQGSIDAQHRLAAVLDRVFPNGLVLACTCMRESLELLTIHPIDIAVIDLDLPDGSGIELIQECARLSPLTRCVVTTSRDDDDCLARALSAGALGYLLNTQPESVLVLQLRLLDEGVPPLAPSVAHRLVQYFKAQGATPVKPAGLSPPQDDLTHLSEREKQALGLIAKGMHIGEVAKLLDITANTVCSHVKSIYRKRHLSSRAEAALEARRLGLV